MNDPGSPAREALPYAEAVARALALVPDALVIAANGDISRAVHAAGDDPGRFYMIGSMGLASSIGLGVALGRPDRRVVVVDGDGNLLMNLGGLVAIGAGRPAHYYHLVIDNGIYAATGGQRTLAGGADLAALALAAGYRRAETSTDPNALATLLDGPGPALLRLLVAPGDRLALAPVPLRPEEIRDRFAGAARGL